MKAYYRAATALMDEADVLGWDVKFFVLLSAPEESASPPQEDQ